MKSTAKIFYGLTVFMLVASVVYYLSTTYVNDSGSVQKFDWAGGTPLFFSALLCLMLAGYFHITDRKMDIAPSDWEEAEIEDGTGVLGFFSAGSIWPFYMTVSIAVLGLGIAFFHLWLVAFGAVMLIGTTTMLNLEYGLPPEKH